MKIDLKTSESAILPFHTVASLKERLAWLINLRWISIIALLFCIPEEDVEKIFEEFYRSKNAREAEQIGTGLGLNLVKEIVSHYKGRIEVQSKLSKGSEFKVEFPLEENQTSFEQTKELKQSVFL
jgi:signal transduction histidine kinase